MRTKTYSFAPGHWEANRPNTEIGPATPTPSESSDEIAPASSSKVLPQSEQKGYLAQTPTTPQKPQSKLNKLASKSKSLFRKMGRIFKSLFGEMVDNPKLQIH